MTWQPIESAPKDGRPVWVRGNNWGKPDSGHHYGWAYFDDDEWRWPDARNEEGGTATFLTHWMPLPEPPK